MALIYVYKNRGITKDFTITKADGTTLTPQANDKIRAIIGREGKLQSDLSGAKLTVTSGSNTTNGSSFTKNSPSSGKNRLRLDASDLDFEPGVYTLLIDYFDNADSQEWKTVSRQILVLRGTE